MLTNEGVVELVGSLQNPFTNTTLLESNSILEVKIKEDKGYVSVKVGLSKTGTGEQLQLQTKIVDILKNAGFESVGIRFEEVKSEEAVASNNEGPVQIAIASGKGGVGKSTVTVNIAVALARLGKKVGIIDADIYGFSIPDMMGVTKRPVVRGDKIIPVERFGVKIISMGFFVEDNAPVIWRGPMLGKMLKNFFDEVEWGELDYLLLDLPPGTGDVALDIHSMLPSCKEIIVTTPHPTAAFVAARAGAMALKTEHEIIGVVENMSYYEIEATGEKVFIFGKGGGEKLVDELQTTMLGKIPLGQPFMDEEDFAPSVYRDGHSTALLYDDIAKNIIDIK